MKKLITIILSVLIIANINFGANNSYYYEIVSDFIINSKYNTAIYYSIINTKELLLFAKDFENKKNLRIFRPKEKILNPPILSTTEDYMAYHSLYNGNDILWITSFKEDNSYRIPFNISGRLKNLEFSNNENFIILSFLSVHPTHDIYIIGTEKSFMKRIARIPYLRWFSSLSNNQIDFTYKNNGKIYLAKYNINFNNSEIEVSRPKLIHNDSLDKIIYKNRYGVVFESKNTLYSYTKNGLKQISSFKLLSNYYSNKNLFLINNKVYNNNFKIHLEEIEPNLDYIYQDNNYIIKYDAKKNIEIIFNNNIINHQVNKIEKIMKLNNKLIFIGFTDHKNNIIKQLYYLENGKLDTIYGIYDIHPSYFNQYKKRLP